MLLFIVTLLAPGLVVVLAVIDEVTNTIGLDI